MEPYDGSSDLLNDLKSYKALMMIQEAINAHLYLAFLVTLRKSAQVWNSSLQTRTIFSFEQLKT